MLEILEEAGILAFEWTEKTLDVFYESLFDMAPESAQKATAWTGLLLILLLIGWGGRSVHGNYHKTKANFSHWRKDKKAELEAWWQGLPWSMKIAHALGLSLLIVVLMMLGGGYEFLVVVPVFLLLLTILA